MKQQVSLEIFKDPMNVASIPYQRRAGVFQDENRKQLAKTAYENEVPKCCRCSKYGKDANVQLVDGYHRCEDCYMLSLEYIFLAYEPRSKWSGVDPRDASHFIRLALDEGWSVSKLSFLHDADHATDDVDSNFKFNRKIKLVSVYKRVRKDRYREIVNGGVKIMLVTGHRQKSREMKDNTRNSEAFRTLVLSRRDETWKRWKSVNVSELENFTKPLRDPKYGGFKFPLKQFLQIVLPYWEFEAAKLRSYSPEESTTKELDPYFMGLKKFVEETSVGSEDD